MSKDFYNVGELSKRFVEWQKKSEESGRASTYEIELWQVRAQLAIAQQLSMVAKHLGEIVSKAKEHE